jgi:SNF2 family DNA or RNA helicase
MVHDIVPEGVRHLLHAGDTQGAIEALGMKMEDTGSIVEAVTTNLQKELVRLEATRAFKESLEYSTPRAKEEALKTLDDKIGKTKQSIQALKERIENFKQDTCPICYDDPQEPLLTPCCNRVFCGQCLLTCMTRSTDCPMCRNKLHPNQLVRIVSDEEKNKIVASGSGTKEPEEEDLKKKPDALLHLFKQNPEGRFLVFSRYDNPFTTIEAKVAALGVKVRQLKGNKDVIAATLRNFQAGEIKCLLLNSSYAGAGLNITAATHVILLHAMTLEEEKQILGRAYRMGRQGPLTFIKLLHPDEMPPADPLPSVAS